MKRQFCSHLLVGLTLWLAAAWCRPATAQELKPVAVVSISSVGEVMGDVSTLSQAIGAPELGGLVMLLGGQYTEGVHPDKPVGAYVMLSPEGQPIVVGFVPVTNLDGLLGKLGQSVGKPEPVGEGMYKLSLQQDLFIKKAGDWAFLSNQAANIENPPPDPAPQLAGLDKEFDLAVRLFVQQVPEPLRQMAVQRIKEGFEQAVSQSAPTDNEGLNRQLTNSSLQSFVRLIEETDQVTVGWAIDRESNSTRLDVCMTAMAGTVLAEQMAAWNGRTTVFSGFKHPDAALQGVSSSPIAPEEIAQSKSMLDTLQTQLSGKIDDDASLGEEVRAGLKKALATLVDVGKQTLDKGEADAGVVLLLEPRKINFAAGCLLADGKKVEQSLKELVALAKDDPDVPKVNFNVENYQGIDMHMLVVPLPPKEDVQKVLGPSMDVVIGTSEDRIYLAFGQESLALLKNVIAKSAEAGEVATLPMEIKIAAGPVFQFASSVAPDNPVLSALAGALNQAGGQDQITIHTEPIAMGMRTRIHLETGVLRLITAAVKSATMARQQSQF